MNKVCANIIRKIYVQEGFLEEILLWSYGPILLTWININPNVNN